MFCSEFVASVLKECNIVNFENPSLVQPVDLTKIEGIECVHKGTYVNLYKAPENLVGYIERMSGRAIVCLSGPASVDEHDSAEYKNNSDYLGGAE